MPFNLFFDDVDFVVDFTHLYAQLGAGPFLTIRYVFLLKIRIDICEVIWASQE